MGDKKLNALIAVLVIIIAAATYITVNIPPPQDKQIAEINAQTDALQTQVTELRADVKRLTHPAVIQERTMDMIYQRGEFEDGKNP